MACAEIDWLSRLALGAACCAACAYWTRVIVAPLRPGRERLLAATPVVVGNVFLPFLFDIRKGELLSFSSTAGIFSWISNFKVLAFCLNRGPLTAAIQQMVSSSQFIALQLAPIVPNTGVSGELVLGSCGKSWSRAWWRAVENLLMTVLGVMCLIQLHSVTPMWFRNYAKAYMFSAYCDLWSNVIAAWVMSTTGLGVGVAWDRPIMAASLAEFWARRWNMPTAAALKMLVYDPIMEGCWVRRDEGQKLREVSELAPAGPVGDGGEYLGDAGHIGGPQTRVDRQHGHKSMSRRLLALCTTFAVSGILHELLLWACSRSWSMLGRQTVYFTLQAPLMMMEYLVKRWSRQRRKTCPRLLKVLMTNILLQLPAYFLFWPTFDIMILPGNQTELD